MTPRKNPPGKKGRPSKLLKRRVLLKCEPCSQRFPSSVELIHHVFNHHNFQPSIDLNPVISVDELLCQYIVDTQKKKRRGPAKPRAKKTPAKKRKLPETPGGDSPAVKPKKPKKEKKSAKDLKVALLAKGSDGYIIPKIKIGRFDTINAFNLDYNPQIKPSKGDSKPFSVSKQIILQSFGYTVDSKPNKGEPLKALAKLSNQLEPIVNSSSANCTVTSLTSTVNTNGSLSNGSAATSTSSATTGDDGLSTLMSEVYNVLDGEDSESRLSLPPSNGEPSAQEFLEMREIQGLYDDDMTYTHLASAFEIPQMKSTPSSSLSSHFPPESSSLLMSTCQSPYLSPSYQDPKNSSKMLPGDSVPHNLGSILNKAPSSCMLENSSNPYLSTISSTSMSNSLPNHTNTSAHHNSSSSHHNNTLPNHNTTGSAFTSMKSGASHSPMSASYLMGISSSGVASPSSTQSSHKSSSSPALSPHVPPSSHSPHVPSSHSPHVPSPTMSPHSTTPSSPVLDTKKKSGLNLIPTAKLMDNTKPNQLVNNKLVTSHQMNSTPLLANQLAGPSPFYSDSNYSAYYSTMYSPYVDQMSGYTNQQYISTHSSPYFANNFYTTPTSQSVEDSQYKRVGLPSSMGTAAPMGPPLGSSSMLPSHVGLPPYKRSEDSEFKKPSEPVNKQPKIVPKKLSSLLEKDGKKASAAPRIPTGSMVIQRTPSLHSIARPPITPLQLRGVGPLPSPPPLKPPRAPGAWPPTVGLSGSPAKPILPSSPVPPPPDSESPAASALKKRGITISSVTKPAIRKLTSSVNITPVVKKPCTGADRVGSVELVSKTSAGGSSRPAELLKDAECNLGIPVVDLSNQAVLSNLSMMGITSFIPVNQMRGSNQIFALPIVNTGQVPRRLDDLGAAGVLSLGSVYKLK